MVSHLFQVKREEVVHHSDDAADPQRVRALSRAMSNWEKENLGGLPGKSGIA